MQNKQEILSPDCTYHIFNRANGHELLFLSNENYLYFMKRYAHYINPIADTFCYCLMPNHFHFLIRIKSEQELTGFFKKQKQLHNLTGYKNLSNLNFELEKLLSQQFSNFLNSYSKAFNKQHNRRGSLFMRPFKRIKVSDEHYRQKLVHYIHFNPVEAQLCQLPHEWFHSSYTALIGKSETQIKRTEVISWFDDLENLKFVHLYPPQETGIDFF